MVEYLEVNILFFLKLAIFVHNFKRFRIFQQIMENLWKKESTESSALHVDLFTDLDDSPIILERATGKSNAIADKHRAIGNRWFEGMQWLFAIEEYNKSLCLAEYGTESMSLSYANRANCFLRGEMYKYCMADIELAIESNYPERLMAKLQQRKADCMRKRDQREYVKPKLELSYPSHENIPFMANVSEIQHNSEFGRHIVAKCPIPAGKTILIEPSYVSQSIKCDYHHCWTCQAAGCSLIPCKNCTIAMFCSVECVEKGRIYHGIECGFKSTNANRDCSSRFVARTIFKALGACNGSVDELAAFVESVRNEPTVISTALMEPIDEYRLFLQLSKSRAGRVSVIANSAYRFIMAIPEMERLFKTLTKKRFLMHLTCMHASILVNNGCGGAASNDMNQYSSISLVYSLFNHQCASNVFVHRIDDADVCFTIRPIEKGEQLFISYVKSTRPNRRQFIFDAFGFWCVCTKCVPVELESHQKRRMEKDEYYKAIQRFGPFNRYAREGVIPAEVKNHCIQFLNAFGRLPDNEILESIVSLYKQCISYEHGAWE